MLQNMRAAARQGLPLCLLASLPAYGDEPYRLELRGGVSSVSVDDRTYAESSAPGFGYSLNEDADTSLDRLGLSGVYYFDDVTANGEPLHETAFLSRASALTFSVSNLRARREGRTSTTGDFLDFNGTYETDWKERNYDLRYRFVAPERSWIGIVGAGHLVSRASSSEYTRASYSLGIGRFVGQRTSVVAEYGRSRLDVSDFGFRDETLSVGVRSLFELGAQRHLAVTATLERTQRTDVDEGFRRYEVGVAYYPRHDISIALSTTGNYGDSGPGDDSHRRGYLLRGSWFVTEKLGLGLGYETNDDRWGFGDPGLGSFSRSESIADGFRFDVSWRH